MVFTLVEPATDKYALPGDRLDAAEWRRVFLETGGMRHLLDLLKQDSGIDPSQVQAVPGGLVVNRAKLWSST